MALFEFELAPVEAIEPPGQPEDPQLSWFALTDGRFCVQAGDETLFRYTPELRTKWGLASENVTCQIADFADLILEVYSAVIAPLPAFFEHLASDAALLRRLWVEHDPSEDDEDSEDRMLAFRWLGERSLWTGFLVAAPHIWFTRIADEVWMHWDNTGLSIEGFPAWTASRGVYRLGASAYKQECRQFVDRLLYAMERRIEYLAEGTAMPRVAEDAGSLRAQHIEWKDRLDRYFGAEYQPELHPN